MLHEAGSIRAFSNDSGCSGAALSRENTGETVKDIMALAKKMTESLNKNTTDGFRLDTDDDIYIVIQNHIAAIFYDIVPEPVATFDIFGLATFTDKYNCHRWYYRGMWLYERTPGGRIYCVNKNNTIFWRKDIERALAHIDNLLLQKSLKEREKS